MTLDFEPVNVGHHILDTLDARVAEFHHMMAVETNQMVMLPVPVGCFVFGRALAELMPDDQIALQEKIERVVYRGPTDGVARLLQMDKQFIRIQMSGRFVNGIQDQEALRCLSQLSAFQELPKPSVDFQAIFRRKSGHRGTRSQGSLPSVYRLVPPAMNTMEVKRSISKVV